MRAKVIVNIAIASLLTRNVVTVRLVQLKAVESTDSPSTYYREALGERLEGQALLWRSTVHSQIQSKINSLAGKRKKTMFVNCWKWVNLKGLDVMSAKLQTTYTLTCDPPKHIRQSADLQIMINDHGKDVKNNGMMVINVLIVLWMILLI